MAALRAQSIPIPIPNGSFESPATFFVSTFLDSWQEAPKPAGYVEGGGFTWDQLTGLFVNTAPGAGDHIDNCDGKQAAYLFAVPEAGWFQDHDSRDWNDPVPSHAFDARFEAGKSYELSFGVIAGGGNMLEGVSFEAALYFRDAATQMVTVTATNVVFAREVFPDRKHLTYFRLRLQSVQMDEAWVGQYIGVRFLSTVSPEMQGGYWDLDDVGLVATADPKFAVSVGPTGSGVRLSWPSVMGFRYQIESSEDFNTWSSYGTPLAGTGDGLSEPVPSSGSRSFFRVRATVAP